MSAEQAQESAQAEEVVTKRTSNPRKAKERSLPPSSEEALALVNDIPDTDSDDETFHEEEEDEEEEESEDESSDTETLVTSDDEPPAKKPRSTEK